MKHDRSQFRDPPMPAHRYVEENGLAFAPQVNLRVNKAAHSGIETSPEVQNRGISGLINRTYVLQKFNFQIYFLYLNYLDVNILINIFPRKQSYFPILYWICLIR